MAEVAEQVKAIIVDKFGVDSTVVTETANFTNDLGADSLDTVELIMEFEKAFNISKDESIKINIAEYLKNICYRFREKDPKYEAGFEKYSNIVKEGRIQ